MPFALPDKKSRSKHKLTSPSLQKLFEFWHHEAAWIVSPLLIGLIAVLLAFGSDKATTMQSAFFNRHILALIIAMPAGFALAAYLTRRFFLSTQGSSIPGGIFAPSLAAKAGIGDNIAAILPGLAPHSAIVLLTMAAYLSGVTRAPATSFIITMEMTNSHEMLLSLMITALVATSISKFICPTPLYHALADRFQASRRKVASSGASR
jgi:H+/Cl- antiporter ClcA